MEHKNNEQLPAELLQYLALCERVYQRMEREGTWPWPDWNKPTRSPNPADMVESKDNPQ